MKGRALVPLCALLGLALLCASAIPQGLAGQNDFIGLYTGASLVSNMYSPAANVDFQQSHFGAVRESFVYSRPAFHALLLWPLAQLPYRVACGLFQLLNLTAGLWFVWRFSQDLPALPVLAALSLPMAIAVLQGQDTLLLLASAGGAILLHRAGRPFLAGLLWSVCAVKPHLVMLVPVALAYRKEWRVLLGAVAGGVGLMALSIAVLGWHWPLAYIDVLTDPRIHPHPEQSISLRGLTNGLHASTIGLVLSSVVVLAAAVYRMAQCQTLQYALAIALVGSALLSFHAYPQDAVLLMLVLVLTGGSLLTALVTLPPAYILLLQGVPVVPVCLLALLVFMPLQPGIELFSKRARGLLTSA